MSAVLPALTSILAALFAVMLLDQWRDRRHGFQLVWAFGMRVLRDRARAPRRSPPPAAGTRACTARGT